MTPRRTMHSPYSPSSAHRRLACPGSMHAEAAAPGRPSGEAALEGTALHALAEMAIKEGADPVHLFRALKSYSVLEQYKKTTKKTEVIITSEGLETVKTYVDRVLGYAGLGAKIHLEETVYLPRYRDAYGTADAICHNRNGRWVAVCDFKSGRGLVEVEDNPQLIFYALGALHKIGPDEVDTVRIEVIQPLVAHPDGPIRTQTFSREALIKKWLPIFQKNFIDCQKADAPRHAGPHCQWCDAATACGVLHANQLDQAIIEFKPLGGPLDKISEVLQKRKLVKALVDACEKEAIRLWTEEGIRVPGTKVIRGGTHRKWKRTEDVIAHLHAIDAPLIDCMKLKTPAQLEKVVDGLDEFVTRGIGALRVVDEDEKGAEVSPPAEKEFTK